MCRRFNDAMLRTLHYSSRICINAMFGVYECEVLNFSLFCVANKFTAMYNLIKIQSRNLFNDVFLLLTVYKQWSDRG